MKIWQKCIIIKCCIDNRSLLDLVYSTKTITKIKVLNRLICNLWNDIRERGLLHIILQQQTFTCGLLKKMNSKFYGTTGNGTKWNLFAEVVLDRMYMI